MENGNRPVEVPEINLEELLSRSLVVYNDDYNTFDHVINCFVNILNHSTQQAEQCARIIHNNGKCGVKSGDYEELVMYKYLLIELGLNVVIE